MIGGPPAGNCITLARDPRQSMSARGPYRVELGAINPRPQYLSKRNSSASGCYASCQTRTLARTIRSPRQRVAGAAEARRGRAPWLQRQHGVDLRCQVTITSLEGDAEERLRCAHLSDGRSLDTEVAVVVLGAAFDLVCMTAVTGSRPQRRLRPARNRAAIPYSGSLLKRFRVVPKAAVPGRLPSEHERPHSVSASNKALASFRSHVSKPSTNQL
jgi:hypothetical protein